MKKNNMLSIADSLWYILYGVVGVMVAILLGWLLSIDDLLVHSFIVIFTISFQVLWAFIGVEIFREISEKIAKK